MPKIALATVTLAIAFATPVCLADQRSEWGAPVKLGPQLDDGALMEVTGRGALDENAVKVLQTSGKLSELASSLGLHPTSQASAILEASEKQMVQAQQKMALGITQNMMSQTIQVTSTVVVMAAPITAPVAGLPMLGLPMVPR